MPKGLKNSFLLTTIIFGIFFSCLFFNNTFADGPGCTDSLANNYDETATVDDGSCDYPLLAVSVEGDSQLATVSIPSTENDLGGAFTFQVDEGEVAVTSIAITQVGSLSLDDYVDSFALFYKAQATCENSMPGDATSWGTASFTDNVAVVTGNSYDEDLIVGTDQICVYPVYELVGASAESLLGYSIDLEISSVSDVTIASGNIEMAAPLNIPGVTILVDTDITTSLLSLRMADSANDPTVYYLKDDAIWKKVGANSPVSLTNSNLIVQTLNFFNLTGANNAGTVRAQAVISNVAEGSNSSFLNVTKTYSTTASVKSNTTVAIPATSSDTSVPPVIVVTGDTTPTVNVGDEYIDEGATATDSFGVDITADIVTVGVDDVDTDTPGDYEITYNVTDAYGNAAVEKTRTVTVSNSTTVPDAPTIGTATAGNATSTVTYTAGYDGGSAILYYTITSSSTAATVSATTTSSTTATLTGLTNGTAYTFSVTATNAIGISASSSDSNLVTPSTIPSAPTIGTATAGNTTAVVTYTASSTGGSAITSFTVTSSPGSISTTTTSTTTATVTGLTNATAYTFTVVATNANGTSTASVASNSVTPAGVPGAPTIGTASTSTSAQATVTYTAPASNGGSAILDYTVTSNPGSISTTTTSATTAVVTGLTDGTAYTFTVTARNANGNSTASSASNSVTPTGSSFMAATGGTITTSGNYKIHSFTSSGTFTVTTLGSGVVETLVVAGGGGGGSSGNQGSGGGGAGGLTYNSALSVSAQAYSVTVGAGGAVNANGATSTFSTISTTGGGKGGTSGAIGTNGGSGSGGGSTVTTPGAGIAGQGFSGGNGNGGAGVAERMVGGGGGGAGGIGGDGSASGNGTGGSGGVGSSYSISGSSVCYAGGGGGGNRGSLGSLGSATCGGGTGGSGVTHPTAGTANLGGGGGGSASGAAGGSGVVIIKYQYQ